MEEILREILVEMKEVSAGIKELNRQVAATNQTGQTKMGEADALMKNIFASLPANLMKGVNSGE